MEETPYVVCFRRDGQVDVFTLEHYHANTDSIKFSSGPSEDGYYCFHSVDAVNGATAVAIAVTELLNNEGCIDELAKHYLEAHDWELDSTDDVDADSLKGLDRLLSTFARDERESVLKDLVELVKPCRWNPRETESAWINEREKKPEFTEIATTSGRHRAFVRCEEDIPPGWIRASDLPSPGQVELAL